MANLELLRASNGNGEATRSIVTQLRVPQSTSLVVDSTVNWPQEFIATSGKLLTDNTLDPATVTVFEGHLSSGNIEIDAFASGYADIGNSVGDIVLIKPTTHWANLVTDLMDNPEPTGIADFSKAKINVFPVGSIQITANNVSPDTWHVGTWVAFGTGRTLVGYDAGQSEFNTAGKTGGHIELQAHSHVQKVGSGAPGDTYLMTPQIKYGTSAAFDTVGSTKTTGGGDGKNLPPYITVFFWQRVS